MITQADIGLWKTRMAAGRMAADSGSYLEGARHFRMALELAKRNLEPSLKARALNGLARCSGGLGKNEEAEKFLHEAISIDQSEGPSNAIELAVDRLQLAALLREKGDQQQARQVAQTALDDLSNCDDVPNELLVALMRQLAITQLETGHYQDCELEIEKALNVATAMHGVGRDSLPYAQLLMVKVLLLIDLKRIEDAEQLFHDAMQTIQIHRGPHHPRNAEFMQVLARHLAAVGHEDVVNMFTSA